MARKPDPPHMSDEQRRKVCAYLSIGCDREAAAKLSNCSHPDMRREMSRDPAFAVEVRRAEAAGELIHVRNVQNAAQDVKNWRASVWWLERHSPERFARRGAGTVTTRQLKAFVAQLASIVIEELPDAADRQRLLDRFEQLIKTLDQLIFDDASASSDSPGTGPLNLLENSTRDEADPCDGDTIDVDDDSA